MRWVGGQKMLILVHVQGSKCPHGGRQVVKKGQNHVHVVIELTGSENSLNLACYITLSLNNINGQSTVHPLGSFLRQKDESCKVVPLRHMAQHGAIQTRQTNENENVPTLRSLTLPYVVCKTSSAYYQIKLAINERGLISLGRGLKSC